VKVALAIAPLVPQLRSQAWQWTGSQDEADDIVIRALTLAIDDVPGSHIEDVQGWLATFLRVARDELTIQSHPAQEEWPSAVPAGAGPTSTIRL
jgi:DNA-directed RNA polymerase specialized sigma24 family protein